MPDRRAQREHRRSLRPLQDAVTARERTMSRRELVKRMKMHPFSSAQVLCESAARLSMPALALRRGAL